MADNIYRKLQKARVMLNEAGITKTGKTAFGNTKIFELADFMPQANKILDQLGLFGACNFEPETHAKLTVFNSDNPEEKIDFFCQKAEAGIRQGTPMQNVGGQQTYIRRYLWMQVFEITENDQIDVLESDQRVSQADYNRVRFKPETPKTPTIRDHKNLLEKQETLAALTLAWASIPNKYKVQELINFASECKRKMMDYKSRISSTTNLEELNTVCSELNNEQQEQYIEEINSQLDSFELDKVRNENQQF